MKDPIPSVSPASEADFELDLDLIFAKPAEINPGKPPKRLKPSVQPTTESESESVTETLEAGINQPQETATPKTKAKLERKNTDGARAFTRISPRASTFISEPAEMRDETVEKPKPPSVATATTPSSATYGRRREEITIPDLTPNKAHEHLKKNFQHAEADFNPGARLLKFLGIVAALSFIVWWVAEYFQAPITRGLDRSTQAVVSVEDKIGQASIVARQFVEAKSWSEKMRHILDAERLRYTVKDFYSSKSSPEPNVISIQSRPPQKTGSTMIYPFVLTLSGGAATQQLQLRETPEGFKVDWEQLVGLGAMSWVKFNSERPKEPTQMRVTLSRSTTYEGTYADTQKYHAYKIDHPSGSPSLLGYVESSSRGAQALLKLTANTDAPAMANLYLQFDPEAKPDQVRIIDLTPEGQR